MKRVIAADFGAGNTSFFTIVTDAKSPSPSPMIDSNAVPSGYYVTKDSQWHVGNEMNLDWEKLKKIKTLHINIKAIPNQYNEAELVEYFKAWLSKLKLYHKNEIESSDELYWMIGCPTGDEWKSKEVRDRYRDIFVKAGYGAADNIMIIPESNAAIAYYQYEQGAVDFLDKGAGLLLIDQGAYSLDATYYHDGEITSVGSYLGASIIERMMLQMILYFPEEKYRMNRREHNLPETLDFVKKLYEAPGEKGDIFRTFLLLKARELKEDYFTQLNNDKLSITRDLVKEVELGEENDFEPLVLFTNRRMMQDILEEIPVRDVLGKNFGLLHEEVRNELGNCTWMQAFNAFLKRVDDKFPDFYRASARSSEGIKKPVVLLTGGGSLMDCIVDTVSTHYTNAAVNRDFKAIIAIGMGMAYWAPAKIKAKNFSNALVDILSKTVKGKDGKEVDVYSKYLNEMFMECYLSFCREITNEITNAILYGITEWREYRCSGNDISAKIKVHFDNWVKSKGIPAIDSVISTQLSKLKQNINSELSVIFSTYGLGDAVLFPEENTVFLAKTKILLKLLFEAIPQDMYDYYTKEIDIGEIFPDYSKGLFSDKRLDHYNHLVDHINAFLDELKSYTKEEIIWGYLTVTKYHLFTDDEDCTIFFFFMNESLIDLLNLVEENQKRVLGKLVLEEYVDV